MTLGWGIVATGRIAQTVGAVIASHPHMTVAAVGSRSADRARGLAAELGAPRSFGSYAALLEDPAVQAVYVATPHAEHAEVAAAALRAGKPVLCEKPLTATLAETERLVAVAGQTGTFLMEAMWMRFNPLVRRLADLVASGGLGDMRSVHASFGFVAPTDPTGRLWAPALGGGALLDLGVYTVDFAQAMLGTVDSVEVLGSLSPTGVDAESVMSLGFRGGGRALLTTSLLADLPGTAQVVGTRGWGELTPTFHAATRLVLLVDGRREEHTLPDRLTGFRGELDEVARCVAAGMPESPVRPLADTLATMRVLADGLRLLGAPTGG